LTAAETFEFDAFFKAHALADLQHFGPAEEPSTRPATEPEEGATATTAAASEPAAPADLALARTQPEASAGEHPFLFRFTDARPDQTRTIVIQSPGKNDHPVIDLLHMVARFRDGAPFAGRYSQPIPLTAKPLFADPNRRVSYVWHQGGDLRIVVTASPHAGEAVPEESGERWLAYQDGHWEPSVPPPEFAPNPTTTPASASAAQLATQPATTSDYQSAIRAAIESAASRVPPPATQPDIGLLLHRPPPARVESWWTQPNRNSTTVFHYMPLSPTAGTTVGFVVPAFEFDDDHCAVDAGHGMLYLIHDGQLFSLPIPPAALKPQENP
jgi:hypothetical protein